jgi:hypothetical protein
MRSPSVLWGMWYKSAAQQMERWCLPVGLELALVMVSMASWIRSSCGSMRMSAEGGRRGCSMTQWDAMAGKRWDECMCLLWGLLLFKNKWYLSYLWFRHKEGVHNRHVHEMWTVSSCRYGPMSAAAMQGKCGDGACKLAVNRNEECHSILRKQPKNI